MGVGQDVYKALPHRHSDTPTHRLEYTCHADRTHSKDTSYKWHKGCFRFHSGAGSSIVCLEIANVFKLMYNFIMTCVI